MVRGERVPAFNTPNGSIFGLHSRRSNRRARRRFCFVPLDAQYSLSGVRRLVESASLVVVALLVCIPASWEGKHAEGLFCSFGRPIFPERGPEGCRVDVPVHQAGARLVWIPAAAHLVCMPEDREGEYVGGFALLIWPLKPP